MTTSEAPAPDELPGSASTDEEYGALRASAALWTGASVLITNQHGEVLVQHVDYRDTCLLPGGAVDKGESPSRAAARELREELGVMARVDRGLAVDWVSPGSVSFPAAMRFPGEILHVYDGGTWTDEKIASVRLPDSEITGIELVEPARLPALMSPSDARRALSALRARINAAGAVLLENGAPIAPTLLDHSQVLCTARAERRCTFHPGQNPQGRAVRGWQGWLFTPDGRVVILLQPNTGNARLPAGPVHSREDNPVNALIHGVSQETAVRIGEPLLHGHLNDPDTSHAYARYAAAITGVEPMPTGSSARALATPEQALELLGSESPADVQLAAVHQARKQLGIPRAAPQPFIELTAPSTG
ncbi:NUDIX hydrolase [Streptomyces hirsutus]|uniref:NUDIX hydrolase n=1 Tax=Streptomyces hirsutus TaxID=35620 RepID=UPI0034079EE8